MGKYAIKYNGSVIYSESNTYNNIGSLLSSNINQNGTSLSKSYTYNNNDELITSTTNGNQTTYYNTPFSNFTSYTDSKDTVLFEYNDNHSLTKKTVNGIDTLYSYDNRGNRVSEKSKDSHPYYLPNEYHNNYFRNSNILYGLIDFMNT